MLLIITLVLLPRAQSVEYLSHIIWLNRWQGAGIEVGGLDGKIGNGGDSSPPTAIAAAKKLPTALAGLVADASCRSVTAKWSKRLEAAIDVGRFEEWRSMPK